uniref:Uncharacterized protein n=1 Tax=Arundo donax TaxID=35708 RepID=A0A0A8ZEF5_ARUDO
MELYLCLYFKMAVHYKFTMSLQSQNNRITTYMASQKCPIKEHNT